MRKKTDQKTIRMRALLVFVITFLIVLGASVLLNQNQERGERLKAIYTAESTVSRVESQLNRYLAKSDLIKKMIESGMDVESNLFDTLSEFMQDERHVIEAHEIAKDGIINLIYPMEGNEASMGLNMFEHPERKKVGITRLPVHLSSFRVERESFCLTRFIGQMRRGRNSSGDFRSSF